MKQLPLFFRTWKTLLTLFVFLFAIVSAAVAQGTGEEGSELEKTLKKLSEDAAKGYISPVASAFGSNLNGGWFHRAPKPKIFSLNLEAGLVGMGTFFPEGAEYKSFSTQGSFRFNSEQALNLFDTTGLTQAEIDAIVASITSQDFNVSIYGPTIIGSKDEHVIVELSSRTIPDPNNPGGTIQIGGPVDLGFGGLGEFLAEITFLPLVAPQACVGTILGTQAVVRYLPEITISGVDVTKDIGKFSWWGWGIQNNPAVFLPIPLPLDVSLGYFRQTLRVKSGGTTGETGGTIFEANTVSYGVTVSKKLGLGILNLTPYAGYMRESSTLHFTYDFTVDAQLIPIDFELKGENKSRLTVGLGMRLLIFNINADYNMGKYKSVTVGFMFAL